MDTGQTHAGRHLFVHGKLVGVVGGTPPYLEPRIKDSVCDPQNLQFATKALRKDTGSCQLTQGLGFTFWRVGVGRM